MYNPRKISEFRQIDLLYHIIFSFSVKKNLIAAAVATAIFLLLLAEGHAVSALIHGGIGLMGTYQDPLQGAVIGSVAMMGALLDGALDALVCVAIHSLFLLFL